MLISKPKRVVLLLTDDGKCYYRFVTKNGMHPLQCKHTLDAAIEELPKHTELVLHNYSQIQRDHPTIDLSQFTIVDLYTLSANVQAGNVSPDKRELELFEIIMHYTPEFFLSEILSTLLHHLILQSDKIGEDDLYLVGKCIKAMDVSAQRLLNIRSEHYATLAIPALKAMTQFLGLPINRDKFIAAKEEVIAEKDILLEKLNREYGIINIYSERAVDKALSQLVDLNGFKELLHSARVFHSAWHNLLAYEKMIDAEGRIKPLFQFHSSTSRAISVSPCVGNVPRVFRYLIEASIGRKIVEVDLSNLEPRIASIAYNDTVLQTDCQNGDMYLKLLEIADVIQNDNNRDLAKSLMIGMLYGRELASIVKFYTGATLEIAVKLYGLIKDRYKELWLQQEQAVHVTRLCGKIESPAGFIRDVDTIEPTRIETTVKNNLIQSEAADTFFGALLELDTEIQSIPSAALIFQLHDSVLIECDEADAENVATISSSVLTRNFEQTYPGVPFPVKVTIGSCWGEN